MRAFRALSIKRKLMLIILLTSGIVLLLACAAFVAYDLFTFRRAMRSDLRTLAAMMAGNNWGALALEDTNRVERSLVTLEARPQIASACFYDSTGIMFGPVYRRSALAGPGPPASPEADGLRTRAGLLTIFQPVMDRNNERVGTLYMVYLDGTTARLQLFFSVVAVILLGAVALALVISARLQRVISEPILAW